MPDLPDINQEFETRRIIRSAVLQDASAFVEQAGGKRAFLYDTPLGQLEAFHARVERTLRDAHAVAGDPSTAFDATEQIEQIGDDLRGEIAVRGLIDMDPEEREERYDALDAADSMDLQVALEQRLAHHVGADTGYESDADMRHYRAAAAARRVLVDLQENAYYNGEPIFPSEHAKDAYGRRMLQNNLQIALEGVAVQAELDEDPSLTPDEIGVNGLDVSEFIPNTDPYTLGAMNGVIQWGRRHAGISHDWATGFHAALEGPNFNGLPAHEQAEIIRGFDQIDQSAAEVERLVDVGYTARAEAAPLYSAEDLEERRAWRVVATDALNRQTEADQTSDAYFYEADESDLREAATLAANIARDNPIVPGEPVASLRELFDLQHIHLRAQRELNTREVLALDPGQQLESLKEMTAAQRQQLQVQLHDRAAHYDADLRNLANAYDDPRMNAYMDASITLGRLQAVAFYRQEPVYPSELTASEYGEHLVQQSIDSLETARLDRESLAEEFAGADAYTLDAVGAAVHFNRRLAESGVNPDLGDAEDLAEATERLDDLQWALDTAQGRDPEFSRELNDAIREHEQLAQVDPQAAMDEVDRELQVLANPDVAQHESVAAESQEPALADMTGAQVAHEIRDHGVDWIAVPDLSTDQLQGAWEWAEEQAWLANREFEPQAADEWREVSSFAQQELDGRGALERQQYAEQVSASFETVEPLAEPVVAATPARDAYLNARIHAGVVGAALADPNMKAAVELGGLRDQHERIAKTLPDGYDAERKPPFWRGRQRAEWQAQQPVVKALEVNAARQEKIAAQLGPNSGKLVDQARELVEARNDLLIRTAELQRNAVEEELTREPEWLSNTLGPRPESGAARWQALAGELAANRLRFSVTDDADPGIRSDQTMLSDKVAQFRADIGVSQSLSVKSDLGFGM